MGLASLKTFFKPDGVADLFVNMLDLRMKLTPDHVSRVLISLIAAEFVDHYKDREPNEELLDEVSDGIQDFLAEQNLVDPEKLVEAATRMGQMVVSLIDVRQQVLAGSLVGSSSATGTATLPGASASVAGTSSVDPVPLASDAVAPS